jgi:hypothetical protein
MTSIRCKRPTHLLPKAIGYTHVINFFGPAGLLAAITVQGQVFIANETSDRILLCANDGALMTKGPVHRFIMQHLQALKNGAIPASLSSVGARKRPSTTP